MSQTDLTCHGLVPRFTRVPRWGDLTLLWDQVTAWLGCLTPQAAGTVCCADRKQTLTQTEP